MLTPYLPYPLSSGGQIRSYNLLKNLSQKHQITLVSLIKHDNEKKYIRDLAKYCYKILPAKRPEKPWTLTNILKTGFGRYPFLVVRNYSPEAKEIVIKELANEKFDLIHAETFYVMPHIPETATPVLLVEQTIEYLVYQHFVDTLNFWPLRTLLRLDVSKIRYWEEFYWRKANRVVAMSEADKKVMQAQVQQLNVSIVPNGVDENFFTFKRKFEDQKPVIIFVGNFKWLQNREAVTILVNQIWPQISLKLPQASLWVVGRFPSDEILALGSERVKIMSNIDDIREVYLKADLMIAPIYGPGGTRYKILEAMATGIPVITTPQGIEGLGAADEIEAIIESEPAKMAESALELLADRNKYARIAGNANQFVLKHYNWSDIGQRLDQIYLQVAHHETKN